MDKTHVIYGSTTGMTEAVAAKVAGAFGAPYDHTSRYDDLLS